MPCCRTPGTARTARVVREAYALNVPLRVAPGTSPLPPLLTVSAENVIVEAVKKAEDGDALIVRLYEAEGAATSVTVDFGFPPSAVSRVNLMEEDPQMLEATDNSVTFSVKPFEVITLRSEPFET